MRVLVAGFQHETNSFANTPGDWEVFTRGDFFPAYARGEAMLGIHAGGGLPIAGFLAEARAADATIVPSCWAGASPSAAVTRDAFDRIRHDMLEDVASARRSGPLDGIYLDLHGAAVCEHLDAPETALLRAIRAQAGPSVPIVASLDLHANVDDALLAAADYLVAYRTYPHIDMVQTGRAAFRLLARRIADGTAEPVAARRIPFLIPVISQSTLSDPAASVYRTLADLEKQLEGSASVCLGFPASDVPHCGPTVWAYGARAEVIVRALEARIVKGRAAWRPHLLDAPRAVATAVELATSSGGPVIIADVQDNPGAGADSNTTGMLHALLSAQVGRRWPGQVALGLLNDPDAAMAAARAGVGATIDLALGRVLLQTLHRAARGHGCQ